MLFLKINNKLINISTNNIQSITPTEINFINFTILIPKTNDLNLILIKHKMIEENYDLISLKEYLSFFKG